MADAYILEALRTPIGKRRGSFSHIRPDDLAGLCLNGLTQRADINPAEVEDVVMGCVTQVGEQGLNVARKVAEQAARFDAHTAATAKAFIKPIPHAELEQEKETFCRLVTSPAVEDALKTFVHSDDPRPYLP